MNWLSVLFILNLLCQVLCLNVLTLISFNRHSSMQKSENSPAFNSYLGLSNFLISSMSYHKSHGSVYQDDPTIVTSTQCRGFISLQWNNISIEQADLLSCDTFLRSIYHIPLVKEDARHISTLDKNSGTIPCNH
jgi:hypothetical protein